MLVKTTNRMIILLGFISMILASTMAQKISLPQKKSFTPRLLNNYVTKNGDITLSIDSYGLTAYVDLSDNFDDASDSTADDEAKYPISVYLYTSQSFLAYTCLDFFYVDCTAHGCDQYTWWESNFTLPYFTVSGYYADATIILDYDNWQFASDATIATSCSSGSETEIGVSRYGAVGLGVNGTFSNFLYDTSVEFTVSVDADTSTGQLLFESDTDRISSSSYVATLSTNADWQVISTTALITFPHSSIGFTTSLLFDWDSDAIGLPSNVFSDVISYFEDAAGVSCDGETYRPMCYGYSGKVSGLPIIKLTIQGQVIDLPPTLYVTYMDGSDGDVEIGAFSVNFKEISSSGTGASYVTPAYSNYIILDRYFLSYYFAVFSSGYYATSTSISLYTQYSDTSPIWPAIVGGVLGFIILVGIICCCIKARRARLQAQANKRLFPDSTTQQPLVLNDQNALNQQTYVYGQNAYPAYPLQPQTYANVPGYNYVGQGNQPYPNNPGTQ